METTKMSINRGMDHEDEVCICNGILLIHKKRNQIKFSFQQYGLQPEIIILSEVRKRKTNTVQYDLPVESKIKHK